MDTILVRYCEIGLKSDPVRRRFEKQLRKNMIDMLAHDEVEALVRMGNARLFVETEQTEKAILSLRKVFGVASISVATVTKQSINDIVEQSVAEFSPLLRDGESFAVRARRDDGFKAYTSMDVQRIVGAAILDANKGRNIKVYLNNPDKTLYIEIRTGRAYIFHSYIECPAGLPLGSQGKVIAVVNDDRSMVSAWLMMKRGCKVIIRGNYGLDILRKYDPHLKVLANDDKNPDKVLGRVLGTSLEGLIETDQPSWEVPLFFPTIGLSDATIESMVESIDQCSPVALS